MEEFGLMLVPAGLALVILALIGENGAIIKGITFPSRKYTKEERSRFAVAGTVLLLMALLLVAAA